jgi:hypothetical protein
METLFKNGNAQTVIPTKFGRLFHSTSKELYVAFSLSVTWNDSLFWNDQESDWAPDVEDGLMTQQQTEVLCQ